MDVHFLKFEEQDVLYIKALENNSDTSEIIAEKQRLRNLPQLVDLCETKEEVEAITIDYQSS